MGNSTSSTRKSTAGRLPEDVRVSMSSDTRPSQARIHGQSLDEEFSDLILHQVKREELQAKELHPPSEASQLSTSYNQFTTNHIEDEFNELNDGLLNADDQELSRNILPNNDDIVSNGTSSLELPDAMDIDCENIRENIDSRFDDRIHSMEKIDSPGSMNLDQMRNHTPTPDFSKVDFTKITQTHPRSDEINSFSNNHSTKRSKHNNHNEGKLIQVEIKWDNATKEPINKIAIIGSFSNWRDMIKLTPSPYHANEYFTTVNLPLGVHKLLYIINNEYRVSEQLPTATDQEGIFFNWFEVIDEQHLFNHSSNNHVDAMVSYDANIIPPPSNYRQLDASTSSALPPKQLAGKYEVDRINKKSNSFLTKITKAVSDIEHVEYMEDIGKLDSHVTNPDNGDNQGFENHDNYPYSNANNASSNKYVPYTSSSNSSFQRAERAKPPITYSSEIPEMFVNYDFFKSKSPNYELPEPPQLPAHLNNVLLNKISNSNGSQPSLSNIPQVPSYNHPNRHDPLRASTTPVTESSSATASVSHYKRPPLRRADSSYYASNKEAYHQSIPNHVILNHLMTTSIRNDVLTVACITRYSGKFVTQIMHSPVDNKEAGKEAGN